MPRRPPTFSHTDTVMEMDLTPVDVRVLGALIEKDVTTPDNYPLSLNALVTACNQTSNRDPVMQLNEDDVIAATDRLRKRGLVRAEQGIGSRVMKYRELLTEVLSLSPAERAVMDVLMLRGPQTVGEIRTRSQRLHDFPSLGDVEQVLHSLADRSPPVVTRLAREPGRKEARYAHLLSGTPAESPVPAAVATPHSTSHAERLTALETAVAALQQELASMRETLEAFRRQFE